MAPGCLHTFAFCSPTSVPVADLSLFMSVPSTSRSILGTAPSHPSRSSLVYFPFQALRFRLFSHPRICPPPPPRSPKVSSPLPSNKVKSGPGPAVSLLNRLYASCWLHDPCSSRMFGSQSAPAAPAPTCSVELLDARKTPALLARQVLAGAVASRQKGHGVIGPPASSCRRGSCGSLRRGARCGRGDTSHARHPGGVCGDPEL